MNIIIKSFCIFLMSLRKLNALLNDEDAIINSVKLKIKA